MTDRFRNKTRLLVGAGLLCVTLAEGREMTARAWYSHVFGKSLVTTVGPQVVSETPRWRTDSENPPLSARKALLIADKAVADAERRHPKWLNGQTRELDQVMLVPCDDYWYWSIEYVWYEKDNVMLGGRRPNLFVVVLMDGTVVQPKETESLPPGSTSR